VPHQGRSRNSHRRWCSVDATVSVDAVVDDLLEHLTSDHHELLLFDVNRKDVIANLLVTDPDPRVRSRCHASGTLVFGGW